MKQRAAARPGGGPTKTMTNRHLVALLTAVAAAGLTPAPAAGQAADSLAAPRTAWGDPDLQGAWSYATLTPLQRPAEVEDRTFFTSEEVAARNARAKQDRPDRPGVDPGSYNAFWVDRGEVLPDRRTSQIVDPPDGRLPLNAAGRARVDALRAHRRMHPADSWLDRSAWDRCITYHGVPPVGDKPPERQVARLRGAGSEDDIVIASVPLQNIV